MPLKSAFAQSINSVAVKLGYELGIHNVAQTAHAMGIESPLHDTPSLSHPPATNLGVTPTNQASEWLLDVPVLPPKSVYFSTGWM